MNPFDWMLRHGALIWFAALALAFGGALVARSLPSGIYPEVEFPRIVVVARSGDAPPDVTQIALTRPLENALATVMGVERIRSKTIRGATELSLLFAPGTDMWRALQLSQSAVAEARSGLPAGAELTVERLSTTSFPILTFNLTGNIDPRRLHEIGEFVLKPAFSRVRGVGRVDVLGGDVREVEVIVDPEKAAAQRVSPSQIADKLRSQTVLQAVGRLEESHSLVTVMASGEPRDLADLRSMPVSVGPNGSPILLGAVAEVVEGAQDRMLRVSGPGGETVLISIARLPGASTPEVVRAVREVASALGRTLSAGVRLTPVYDQAELVDESIASVRDAILVGIALCVLVIAFFLRDLRAGLAASIAVPVTLGITFLPLGLLGQSLNMMSLGGLAVAIGLVIDDAIVVVEAIGRRVEEGMSPSEAASRGTRELMAALLGTTATTVVVFVPMAWLEGVVGRFFSALSVTLAGSVVVSLAIAVTLVPLAAASWIRARPRVDSAPSLYVALYERLASPLMRHPWIGLSIAGALVAVGAQSANHVPSGFLPTMDEGSFVVDYFLPAGTSLTDTDAVARKLEAVLSATPEVGTYSRRTGAELGPATATQVNRGDIMVRLKPSGIRKKSADDVIAQVRAKVGKDVPEARTEFIQVLQDVLNDLSGMPRPLEIKLFGDNYPTLQAKAGEVLERIKDVRGLVDIYPGIEGLAPELKFRVEAAAAARLGKSATDVASELDAALRGVEASEIRRPDRPIGVRVRYPDALRFDIRKLAGLPLVTGSGVVRMSAVAAPIASGSETVLVRESLRPIVILTADLEGRDLGSVAGEVRRKLAGLPLPEGYTLELGGQYEGQQKTQRDLLAVMGFGLISVLIVLLVQFSRARLAFAVLASVPLSVVGALATLWATAIPLNASSLMGCVLLVGLVVKNGILLLQEYEELLEQGVASNDALVMAGRIRLRPILMTTLATIAGLAPLALGLGSGAEIQRPLAVAVIGGLLVSTVVSLLVLPCFVRLTAGSDRARPS
ncbi:MAG: efflux RND transporter permease subunit [Candidatus Wallbacteria bacterium]|nr:efflux RND transporter permease subunit [Candidatus Wallbacteria bacterium]